MLEKGTTLDGVKRILSIVIIHPLLRHEGKKYIENIGAGLRCTQILDLSSFDEKPGVTGALFPTRTPGTTDWQVRSILQP